MLHESYPWKRELRRLRRVLAKLASEPLDEEIPDYRIEKPLLLSAIVVRRLIECWKVTDITRAREFEVQSFPTLPQRGKTLTRLLMRSDIDREFDLSAAAVTSMDAWEICSEIIHSGYINWEVDEGNRFVAIYLASMRNHGKRLLRIDLSTYLLLLDAIANDGVTGISSCLSETGKLEVKVY